MKQESVEQRLAPHEEIDGLYVRIGGMTTIFRDECLQCLGLNDDPFIFWEAYGDEVLHV